MNYKEVAILFANWLSKNFNADNGFGYWIDVIHGDSYSTEMLWDYFEKHYLRKYKIKKLLNEKS